MFKGFKKNQGMTIVELLVAMVIFAVITGVVLFNYGDFNSSLTIQNLADDMALTIRRAQSYAIGVRGSSGNFENGYGVHFRVFNYGTSSGEEELYSGSNKSFILFQGAQPKYIKENNNCGEEGTSCLEMLYIRSSDNIEDIIVKPSSMGGEEVTLGQGETLDIYFKRPNPEPIMCVSDMDTESPCEYSQGLISSSTIQEAKIIVSSLKDQENKKVITMFNSGQISVSNYEEQEN